MMVGSVSLCTVVSGWRFSEQVTVHLGFTVRLEDVFDAGQF